MSYENACDVICVHEDKVNNALSFLEDDKSKKLLNILEKICDEKKLKIILGEQKVQIKKKIDSSDKRFCCKVEFIV